MSNWIPVRIDTTLVKLDHTATANVVVHAVTIVQPFDHRPYVQDALVAIPGTHGAVELVVMPAETFFLTDRPTR